jgi:hypothetical protein
MATSLGRPSPTVTTFGRRPDRIAVNLSGSAAVRAVAEPLSARVDVFASGVHGRRQDGCATVHISC